MRKIERNEEAVSPVIGVILMVAITVILAAVIAAFVFGMTGSVATSKNIGVTAKYVIGTAPNADNVEITYQGGADDSKLVYLKAEVNSGGPGYTSITSGTWALLAAAAKPPVGGKYLILTAAAAPAPGGAKPAGTNKVVVTGKFTDGSESVLLDTTV